ncbi:MAG TPA: leucine-rich repeat protein, partial [Clostridia bacterium]|nr:leucine-rich repeat protein [Clostridia bacterium]
IFKKEYNTTFNLAVVGGKNDVEATSYKGYNVEWCFITYDETNKEIWRNSRNLVWNDEYGGFKLNTENNDEESSNYSLKDVDGNILAQIKDGNITEIQGDIIIKPKYTKKKYMVTLRRQNQELPIEFEVPYLTDFELYNPSVKEYEGKYSSWSEVRDSYLLNTVDSWLTQELVGEESWQNEKWDINWYNNPSMSDNKVDFSYDEQTGTYGYYTIEENTVLYAKDIDNRTYDVTIYYNYNFLQNTYDKEEKYPPLKKDDALELPSDLSSSITYDGIVFSYAALYDFPYSGPTTKYIAPPVTNYDSRTKNVVYYAHYQNRSKYDVKIFDKTQSEAYVDPDSPFIVLDGSIMYSLYSGTQFDSTMLYKGTPTIIAQTKYNNKVFYENFYNVTQVLYTDYLEPYDNKDDALSAIQALINDKQEVIEDYLKLLDILSGYDYDNIDLEKYASCEDYYKKYFTNQENCYDMNKIYIEKNGDSYTYISNAYDTYREEIYDLQQIIKLINDYEENALRATNYENDEYYPYSDSVTHLNAIYEAGVTDYYFAGWYYDSNYTQKADDIASDPENPMSFSVKISKDLILYAKWVDKKKGSEGLIFEKVAPGEVIVVDYLNEAQCQAIYTESVYSKNLNDQGNMPTDLGTKVSLQIPSEHKFVLPDGSIEICTVVGIVNGAFDTNATIISDLALPNSIKFIEESTFKYCNIKAISYQMGETNYLYVDADIVVYQNLNYSDRNGTVLANSKVLGSYQAGVLITYANKSIVNTSYVIPDEINGTPVTKVADYAFRSTPALVGVSLGENITEIGDYAFMGCNKLASVDLPNSLITIGTNAFKDCSLLANVNFVASTAYPVAQLRYIEKDAFSNTSWFINQKGLILVDTILLGVQFRGDGKGYEVDENGDNLVNEYNENFIIGKDQLGNTIYTVYIDANSQTITRIVIDLQLTIITDYAFSGMMSLISLDINAQNLISIDDYAFNNCSGLNVVYFRGADSAINIGENILAGCSRNISFVFPQGYITVNNFLTGDRWVELSSKIDMMEIAEGTQSTLTYYRKARGTTVTIPSFVTEIDDNVFSVGFGDTAEVIIPNTVTKIGENTFANMTNLTSIMIPSSVLEIGLGAFYNCTGLTQMTLPFIGNTSVNNNYLGYIFGDLETTYMNQDFYVPTMLQKLILLDNNTFTEISDYALYNLNIKEITFTNYITRIGKYAFWGNTKLVTLNFNQYIETVDEYAFHGCTSLTTLTFHNYSNLESFGDYSFYGCTSLQALNIITNAYTTTIGNYAFANCTLLRNVYFNQNLESIGNSAFEGCVALGVVNFTSNGVLSVIGANAFKNCTSLQNIIVNKQLSSIGFGAFEGCANLASITLNFIGANLNGTQATHFGYIFGAETYQVGMSKMPISLETVIVQQNGLDQAINIADYAFFNLTNLTLVNISNANIGNEGALAFYGCTATITR